MQPTQSYAIKRHTGRTKQRKNRRSSISAASRFLLLKNLFFLDAIFESEFRNIIIANQGRFERAHKKAVLRFSGF